MQDGFTQHDSKGLFTFYKEQEEPNQFKFRRNKKNKKNCQSLANPIINKSEEKISPSIHEQSRSVIRYKDELSMLKKHQVYTSKHVFSLKFNSPRKNGYYLQLTAARNHRSKTEVQKYSSNQIVTRLNNNRFLAGELSARQMRFNQLKQLFIPKKEYLNPKKRNPMKIKQIIGRLFDEDTKQKDQIKIKRFNIEDIKKQRPSNHNEGKKDKLFNYLFKDVLKLRKQKLQNNHFWQQIKQKKSKANASRVYISKRLEQWIKQNNLNQIAHNHMPSIKKIIFSVDKSQQHPQQPQ